TANPYTNAMKQNGQEIKIDFGVYAECTPDSDINTGDDVIWSGIQGRQYLIVKYTQGGGTSGTMSITACNVGGFKMLPVYASDQDSIFFSMSLDFTNPAVLGGIVLIVGLMVGIYVMKNEVEIG
ncbi:MAG: hypothetical protein ACTSUS_04615, partial [Candidatus Freyarchaeota archaeon]